GGHSAIFLFIFIGVPTGIRTPVTAVKGRCPRPLDDRDFCCNDSGLVEVTGIEPVTSCMPCKRSPSWAIPPRKRGNYITRQGAPEAVPALVFFPPMRARGRDWAFACDRTRSFAAALRASAA